MCSACWRGDCSEFWCDRVLLRGGPGWLERALAARPDGSAWSPGQGTGGGRSTWLPSTATRGRRAHARRALALRTSLATRLPSAGADLPWVRPGSSAAT